MSRGYEKTSGQLTALVRTATKAGRYSIVPLSPWVLITDHLRHPIGRPKGRMDCLLYLYPLDPDPYLDFIPLFLIRRIHAFDQDLVGLFLRCLSSRDNSSSTNSSSVPFNKRG